MARGSGWLPRLSQSWCAAGRWPAAGVPRYRSRPAGRKISRTKTHPHCTERSFLPRSPLPHRAVHSGRQCCPTEPRSERKTAPARGSGTPDETFSTPARHGSGHHEIFIAHTHPKCPISDHFHRAGAIFLSQRHPTRPHDATQGRSFFHAPPRSTPGAADTGETKHTSRHRARPRSPKVTEGPGLRKLACNSIGRSFNNV